ncbi:hypothetical protein FSOLCH5_005527 [Fusarium solani]
MVQDVYTAAAANRDMAVIFPAGIALSRASDRLAWEPGQALGVTEEGFIAEISRPPNFLSPADLAGNNQSSTSRGHQLKHARPEIVGVPRGNWTTDPEVLGFAIFEGDSEDASRGDRITYEVDEEDEFPKPPKAPYEALHPRREFGSASRRRGGGRGGRNSANNGWTL